MSLFRRPRGLVIWLALLPFFWEAGCSRPAALSSNDDPAPADQHQVPFRQGDGSATSGSNPGALVTAQNGGPKSGTSLPFREAQSLPAGTLLTVRLNRSVSSDSPNSGRSFEAVVDEPVIVEGNTLVPRGTEVAGRVEPAGASRVRLTLNSIILDGRELPLQTSSLLARGNAPAGYGSLGVITLTKGRSLTFWLTEPASVASQPDLPGR